MNRTAPALGASRKTPAALSAAAGAYRHGVRRKQALVALLAALLFVAVLLDLAFGPARYSLEQVAYALVAADAAAPEIQAILWTIRMPTALMAAVVGAALAVAGAQMQTILANPLASPFTLGISAAAGFGASLALAFGFAIIPALVDYMVPLNALVMALVAAGIIHAFSLQRGATTERIILLGIALVFSFNAFLTLVQFLASEQAVAAVVFWTMGSLARVTWPKLGICAAVLALVLPIFMRRAWSLTTLRLGEERAASLGIDVRRLKLETMALVAVLASVPVAFVGTIGFVGLVGPHMARLLIGEDQRFFLPASALCGALLLSASSILSKTLAPGTLLPIGIVTAVIGVPFFLLLILRDARRRP
ncbi:FecCD family ABC transporter permease [Aquabacter sp. P-9]|uniref:FecCD family ABC transporter permease n=1 Tax=Aquabacter sediminis TaxID=3029197 RepID=UPI00237DA2FC|nr:iron ABC transporter permease [Aquabacter sp. P-9]MDE1567864.1 iron ABC transporter permease [Aquabacter sp. P-9]